MCEISALAPDPQYQCRYCSKKFVKETTLTRHVCEPKRRHQSRNQQDVQIGLQSYLKFYQYSQGQQTRTWDDFVTSPYYSAFVKFGAYCQSTGVFAPLRFLDWLLTNNKKIDLWCRDTFYSTFLQDLLVTEPVEDALSRAVSWSITWGENSQAAPKDCIRYNNINAICHQITRGQLSGWVIYNCQSGQKFLNELNTDQLSLIYQYINPDFWNTKFLQNPQDTQYAKNILTAAGW
jgi:hypothetical protein